MSLPGFGLFLAIGTALAGVLYLIYQQSNSQNQYTYGSSGSDNVYIEPPWPGNLPEERPHSRKRRGNDHCSICLDISEKDLRILLCGHSFHKRCIDAWLVNHNTCPNCRKTV